MFKTTAFSLLACFLCGDLALALGPKPKPVGMEQCQTVIKNTGLLGHKAAQALYQNAFIHSLDKNHNLAKLEADCAALLENGTSHWKLEAQSISHNLKS